MCGFLTQVVSERQFDYAELCLVPEKPHMEMCWRARQRGVVNDVVYGLENVQMLASMVKIPGGTE